MTDAQTLIPQSLFEDALIRVTSSRPLPDKFHNPLFIRRAVCRVSDKAGTHPQNGRNHSLQLIEKQRAYKGQNYKGDDFNYVLRNKNYVPCNSSRKREGFSEMRNGSLREGNHPIL